MGRSDLPPERDPSRSTTAENGIATSGQLMCYINRTS
jgi:hypothetical protein